MCLKQVGLLLADGLRTSKTVNGVEHVYTLEGSRIVSESWGDNLLIFLYDESGAPIGMQYRNTTYAKDRFDTFYFEKNLFGDIVAVYNSSGVKVISYAYDAWGNQTVTWHNSYSTNFNASYNPFRYRGYYYDTDTGFYYLQSRYYNPQWGRFLNEDGLIYSQAGLIGYNMYIYCGNNPVMGYDPTGYEDECVENFSDDNTVFNDLGQPQGGSGGSGGTFHNTGANSGGSKPRGNNPWGRNGSPAHKAKVQEIKNKLKPEDGWKVFETEKRAHLPNGKYRYPDVTAELNGQRYYFQVGRVTSTGNPIPREQRALNDLRMLGPTVFIAYFPE